MRTRGLDRRLRRLEVTNGAVRLVVFRAGMSEDEKTEFIRSQEAKYGQSVRVLFVDTGVPRSET